MIYLIFTASHLAQAGMLGCPGGFVSVLRRWGIQKVLPWSHDRDTAEQGEIFADVVGGTFALE